VIVRARTRDAHQVAAVIAAAFGDLDVAAWLVPPAEDRQRVLYAHFRILVDHAIDHGDIQMTANRAAAAVWLPRHRPLPDIPDYEHRLWLACGTYTERFAELDAAFDKHHPAEAHHHLALLAVEPARQGRGLGSALLARYHARLDRDRMPAYLEASSHNSRRLYLRYGYADHGDPLDLPDHGPRLWPMWRTPQPPDPSTC
jgi:GNAT superfamily N-acetyltransferase